MRGRARLASTSVAAALALCACGGSGPQRRNGEARKPPLTILADAGAAIRRAGSYALRATFNGGARMSVTGRIRGPGSMQLRIVQGPVVLDIIELPGQFYARGNVSFWQVHLGGRGVPLAGRWLGLPAARVLGAIAGLGVLAPATLSRCLLEHDGTMRVAGTTSLDGRPAIVIKESGDVPGAAPGTALVAATGTPYLLRITSTGPARPGGRVDVCNDGRGSRALGALSLSGFGRVPAIRPPPTAAAAGPTI